MTINERRSLPLWKKLLAILISIIAFGIQTLLIVLFVILLVSFEKELYKTIVGIIYLSFQIVGIFYILYILRKNISLNYKLTWTFLILIAPIPFCILYTLNSNSKNLSRKKQKKFNNEFKDYKVDYDDKIDDEFEYKEIINPLIHNHHNKRTL